MDYSNLKLQEYFIHSDMNIAQCNLLFALRAASVTNTVTFHVQNVWTLVVKILNSHILDCKTLLSGENIHVKIRKPEE